MVAEDRRVERSETKGIHGKWILLVTGLALSLTVVAWAGAQSKASQANATVTGEQQKQSDRLTQLREQVQKDRVAVREAVSQYGWDSENTDSAEEQLVRDRAELRSLSQSPEPGGVAPLPVPNAATTGSRGGYRNNPPAYGDYGYYMGDPGWYGHHGYCHHGSRGGHAHHGCWGNWHE